MKNIKNIFDAARRTFTRLNDIIKRPIGILPLSLILSLFTLVAYNIPAINYVMANVDNDLNGWVITSTLCVLLVVVNAFVYYALLYLGRIVGKAIIAFTFIGNATCLYFINGYNAIMSQEMMGNVFNTNTAEATSFFSLSFVVYLVLLGIVPAILIFKVKVVYKSIWRFLICFATTIAIILGAAFINRQNILWIDSNATSLGGLIMPWSYPTNSLLYYRKWLILNRPQEPLPMGKIESNTRDVCVLVIGESARQANFSLYGYNRKTNPLLEGDNVVIYDAKSASTFTTEGVKAILDHKPTDKMYEILPNYLNRMGVDVIWRSCNSGQPKLKFDKIYSRDALSKRYPDADARYDGILLEGLKEEIEASDNNKLFIVLHTGTSHGPKYYAKYPSEFEVFTPVCKTVEMNKAKHSELVNAYDNTILYTDFMLHSVIETLRQIEDRRCCMIYVSDHGESLGENGLYMHGVPMQQAPKVQYTIPFIVWEDEADISTKELKDVGQHHIFHSVLNFFGITSPIYDENRNIFVTTTSAPTDAIE